MDTMPFVECCKAMQRGVGYAGEGDTLTAAFTGAFLQSWPKSNFVEIFCPDWKNQILFLSHMGEMNYRVAALRPLICRAGSQLHAGALSLHGIYPNEGGEGRICECEPRP